MILRLNLLGLTLSVYRDSHSICASHDFAKPTMQNWSSPKMMDGVKASET